MRGFGSWSWSLRRRGRRGREEGGRGKGVEGWGWERVGTWMTRFMEKFTGEFWLEKLVDCKLTAGRWVASGPWTSSIIHTSCHICSDHDDESTSNVARVGTDQAMERRAYGVPSISFGIDAAKHSRERSYQAPPTMTLSRSTSPWSMVHGVTWEVSRSLRRPALPISSTNPRSIMYIATLNPAMAPSLQIAVLQLHEPVLLNPTVPTPIRAHGRPVPRPPPQPSPRLRP